MQKKREEKRCTKRILKMQCAHLEVAVDSLNLWNVLSNIHVYYSLFCMFNHVGSTGSRGAALSLMMPAEVSPDEDVVVYVMPGSQYSAKVLAALDSRNIAHHVIFVSIRAEQRKLPSGGKMVPECTVGEEVIVDSEVILRYFDEHFDTAFFPTPLAGELSRRASDGVLGGAVLYYNWVYGPSYTRSMRAQGQGSAPAILCCFKGMAIDFMTASHRQKFRLEAATKMGVGDADLEDEPEIYSMLVAELEFFQQHLDHTLAQTSAMHQKPLSPRKSPRQKRAGAFLERSREPFVTLTRGRARNPDMVVDRERLQMQTARRRAVGHSAHVIGVLSRGLLQYADVAALRVARRVVVAHDQPVVAGDDGGRERQP